MITGECYRSEKDFRGDPKNGPTVSPANHVATITGIIFGGQSTSPRGGRQEASDTSGQLGIPRDQFKVKVGDRIVIGQTVYSVTGPREFDYPSNLSGVSLSRYWVDVRAVV